MFGYSTIDAIPKRFTSCFSTIKMMIKLLLLPLRATHTHCMNLECENTEWMNVRGKTFNETFQRFIRTFRLNGVIGWRCSQNTSWTIFRFTFSVSSLFRNNTKAYERKKLTEDKLAPSTTLPPFFHSIFLSSFHSVSVDNVQVYMQIFWSKMNSVKKMRKRSGMRLCFFGVMLRLI